MGRAGSISHCTMTPTSSAQIWFRNQMLKLLPYMPWKGLISGGFQKTVNAVALKDYAR